jgi:hypothetical protein
MLVVTDSATGRPLAGVEVHDVAADSTGFTDATGRLGLTFVADTGGLLFLRKIGFGGRAVHVPTVDRNSSISISLSRAVLLAPVVVADGAPRWLSPALRGFEERRRLRVSGYFVADSVLRKEESRKLGDLLRAHVPGVRLQEGAHAAILLMKSPRCAIGGPPQVFLDGVPLAGLPVNPGVEPKRPRAVGAGPPPFDLSQFNVSDFAGVEYYPDGDQLPMEFSQASDRCGALLLWSREK